MQPAKKFDSDWFWAHINDIYKYTWNPDKIGRASCRERV